MMSQRSDQFRGVLQDRLQSLRPDDAARLLALMIAVLHEAAPEHTKDQLEQRVWEV